MLRTSSLKGVMMLGAHISFDNPMSNIPHTAVSMGLSTFQIFTRNARNMKQRYISQYEINSFNTELLKSGITTFVVHAPYSMNPASPDIGKRKSAVQMISDDMQFISKLAGNVLYVLHPGSHMGFGEDVGIQNLLETLETVGRTDVTICVETMSGAGTELMCTEYCIYKFMSLVQHLNVQLTFDTCHVFSAGLPIIETYKRLAPWCGVIHVNDSKYDFGTYHDRHENLQSGYIPFDTIKELIPMVLKSVPVILETPLAGISKDISLLKIYTS